MDNYHEITEWEEREARNKRLRRRFWFAVGAIFFLNASGSIGGWMGLRVTFFLTLLGFAVAFLCLLIDDLES